MSTRRRARRPEETSLRIAVPASLALYALLFAGSALLPPVAQPERKSEPAAVTVVLDGGASGGGRPAAGSGPARGDGSAPAVIERRAGSVGAADASAAASRSGTAASNAPARGEAKAGEIAGRTGAAAGASGNRAQPIEASSSPSGGDERSIDGAALAPGSRLTSSAGGSGVAGGTASDTTQVRPGGAGDGMAGASAGVEGGGLQGESGRREPGALVVLDLIRARIERARSYPFAARLRGIEGTVTASITVDGQGELSSERIVRTSGSAILDRAGLALLRRVFPVPNDTGSGFDLEVRIAYRLVDGGGSE